MKVVLVPSALAADASTQYLTSYIVNDTIAVDAGSLGMYRDPQAQAAVTDLFLSHSHLDHIGSLPIFLENTTPFCEKPLMVHASKSVQKVLGKDVFNDRLWPNFLKLTFKGRPFLRFNTIRSGQTVEVAGTRVTAVAVNHTVPTLGFIVEDGQSAIVIVSDSGPTQAIWDRANATPNVKAVFLEATFPNFLSDLARASGHLTPSLFHAEMKKLKHPAQFFAVHVKAGTREELLKELHGLRLKRVRIARFGKPYIF